MTLTRTPTELVEARERSGTAGLVACSPAWSRTQLSQIAKVTNGAAFKSADFNTVGQGAPLIRIRDVGTDTVGTWTTEQAQVRCRVRPGDLLVGMDGDFRARVWHGPEALLNQRVCKVEVTSPNYEQSFLNLVLQGYLEMIWDSTSATTVKHLSSKSIQQIPLPHPPLPEQRRIVEMVEEHMTHLDAADASLASAEQRARALIASSRANLVSEGQRLGVDSTVGVHSTEVAYGSSSKTSDASDGVPVLRMGNIQDGQLDWSSLKYLPRDHAEFPKLLLRDGDLLFNRTNSAELVGKSAVFRGERSASYASYLIRVRFDDTVLPEWANLCINSPQGRAHVKSVLAQQVGQANVNGTKLKAFPLSVPPVEDQRRLLESADRARRDALRTTQTTHRTRRRSAILRQAILAAAFSGHLTSTTDPSDLLQESIA